VERIENYLASRVGDFASTPVPSERSTMSPARLIRIFDAVATRLATLVLIAGLPIAAVTFAIQTF